MALVDAELRIWTLDEASCLEILERDQPEDFSAEEWTYYRARVHLKLSNLVFERLAATGRTTARQEATFMLLDDI